MREPEEYKKWHIRESINYYHILLNQDKTIPELYRFVSSIHLMLNFKEKSTRQDDNSLPIR